MRLDTILQRSARSFGDKVALVCDGRRHTYRQIDDAVERVATGLIGVGVHRGERVAIQLENSLETVISIYGILRAGAVFVPLNATIKPEKLVFLLNDCGAVMLITGARKAREMLAAPWQTPALATIVIVGENSDAPIGPVRRVRWSDLLAEQPAAVPVAPRGIDLDLASLIYTSGSTGRPKGVMLAHLNMVAAASSVIEYLDNTSYDVILSVLPLSFSYGLYQLLTGFHVGATVVLEKSFAYPHAILQRMAEEKASGFAIVPTIAAILLNTDIAGYDLGDLRYLTNAGAALPLEHVRLLRARFPRTKLFLMYGQTECKRVSYLPPEELERRPSSVGKPMPNVEAYIVDESGHRLPPGSIGELVVRGANVMRGYWNLPDETQKALRPGPLPGESVLHTGDLFRTDEDGYLYFVARRDDIIKSRGEKVSPIEVEDVLYRLDGVAMAAVVGVPDPVLGAAVKAVITLKDGARLDRNDVLRHCARYLEEFMIPKVLEFRLTMPRNEAGKIDKRKLIVEEEE